MVQCLQCDKIMTRTALQVHLNMCSACPKQARHTMQERDARLKIRWAQRLESVLRIQTMWRGCFARSLFKVKRRLYNFVIKKIQRWYRAICERWQVRQLAMKGRIIIRKRVQRRWCCISARLQDEYLAALCMQRVWRGWRGRLRVQRMPDAATVIMLCYRRWKARKEMLRRFEIRCVCVFRAIGRLRRNQKRRMAARKIQRFLKRRRAWWCFFETAQYFVKRVHGARFIQRIWKTIKWRRAIKGIVNLTRRALMIQRTWRGKLARIVYWELRRIRALKRLERLKKHWRGIKLARFMIWHAGRPEERNRASINWAKIRKLKSKIFSMRTDSYLQEERTQECYRIFYLGSAFWKMGVTLQSKEDSTDNGKKKEAELSSFLARPGAFEWNQFETMQAFGRIKVGLRKLFLAFSSHGVQAVAEAFRLTKAQFSRMLYMCNLDKVVKEPTIDVIFECCNEAVKRPRAQTVQWREDAGKQTEEEAETLELDEFIEAIVRVSNMIVVPSNATQAHRIFSLYERFLCQAADLPRRDWGEPDEACIQLAKRHESELKKVFAHYAAMGQPERTAEKEEVLMDCFNFLILLQECELISDHADLSLATSIELFVMVNVQEIEDFLAGTLRDYELLRAMRLSYDEFIDALQRLFTAIPARGRTDVQRLEDTLSRLYKYCPHIDLGLGMGKLKLQAGTE